MKKSITLLLILMFATLGAVADTIIKEQRYEGKVGPYPVFMYLEVFESGKVTGYYYYFKNGQKTSDNLYLNGKCRTSRDDDEVYLNIKMTETDSNGKVSGTWDITDDFYDSIIWGKFKTSKGKVYNVNLEGY